MFFESREGIQLNGKEKKTMGTRGRSGRLLAWILLFPALGIPEAI